MRIGILSRSEEEFHKSIVKMIELGQIKEKDVFVYFNDTVNLVGGNTIQYVGLGDDVSRFDLIVPEVNMPNIVHLTPFREVVKQQ